MWRGRRPRPGRVGPVSSRTRVLKYTYAWLWGRTKSTPKFSTRATIYYGYIYIGTSTAVRINSREGCVIVLAVDRCRENQWRDCINLDPTRGLRSHRNLQNKSPESSNFFVLIFITVRVETFQKQLFKTEYPYYVLGYELFFLTIFISVRVETFQK